MDRRHYWAREARKVALLIARTIPPRAEGRAYWLGLAEKARLLEKGQAQGSAPALALFVSLEPAVPDGFRRAWAEPIREYLQGLGGALDTIGLAYARALGKEV